MNLSKFLPPRPAHVLDRERLINKLHTWEKKKLVIIHAQAGQGKSTLAAEFLRSLSSASLWYTLDHEDDDPATFLAALSAGLQRALPAQAAALPPLPRDRYGAGGISRDIAPWIAQAFGSIAKPLLIVLDDYHSASPAATLPHLIKALIDTTPAHIRFLLISRTRPELDIVKLRAAQSVGELTGDDLRFTDAEVQDLFGAAFGMQISPTEAALINSSAEGWPAGLVLMHEYLAGLAPEARALALTDRRSAGFQTHVFDYLAQEVFSHLPQETQRFLLRTSIVDSLTLPLMEQLTRLPHTASKGSPSIASMLNELRDRNLFVSVLDNDTGMIRYHALFREFLRKKLLGQTRPAELKQLYAAASAYFRKTGDLVRSIDLSLASGQFEEAIKRIESVGEELVAHGRTPTLMRWMEALPIGYGDRPWFLFYRGVACRFSDPRTSLAFFDLAFKGFRTDTAAVRRTEGLMYSLCGVIEACFHTGGDFTRMGRDASLAQSLLAKNRHASAGARARLLLSMGTAWFFIGRLQQASDALQQALALFRKQGDHFAAITSAIYLTPCALYQGDFRLARETVRLGFESHAAIPDEAGGRAALFLVAAMASLFEGNFDEAQERLRECRGLADLHALESMQFLALDIGGWLKIAQGDYAAAVSLLSACKRKGEDAQNAFFSASAAHLLAIALLFQNKPELAKRESDHALAVRTQAGSKLFHAIYLIASGAIHLKLRQYSRAEKELKTAVALLHRTGAAQQEANAHLVLARLYQATKKPAAAAKHLRAGFQIGAERGFTYYALFNSADLTSLAKEAVQQGICVDYCSQLLDGNRPRHAAPHLAIACFGTFRILRGGTAVRDAEWKGKLSRTFVKLLAAQNGQPISRDAFMEAIWPDEDPDTLRRAFTSMLHRVRKVLEPENILGEHGSCIILKDGNILLSTELVRTDVREFLEHLETAGRMKQRGAEGKCLAAYEKAFALYVGDFLPEEQYSDWAATGRDSLRIRYLRALEDAAGIAETTGDRNRSLAFHERLFAADLCSEKACRWLMARYLADGSRAKAIRTYEQCERALARELDLEPEEKTKKVYRGILGG